MGWRRAFANFTTRSCGADLAERFGYSSTMQVPRLDKIVVNMGVGEGSRDSKILVTAAVADLTAIAGQTAGR